MRIFLVLLMLISTFIYPQAELLTSTLTVPDGTDIEHLYLTYRVPYNKLVFEKQGDIFISEFEILVEVSDTANNIIDRKYTGRTVQVNGYDETNSDNTFAEGLLDLGLQSGKANLNLVFSDRNSGKEFRFRQKEVVRKKLLDTYVYPPIILFSGKTECNGREVYRLVNYEGNIPFTDEQMMILIPVADTSLAEIHVEITSEDTLYWKGTVRDKKKGTIIPEECGFIVINLKEGRMAAGNFYINNITGMLPEGKYNVKLKGNEDSVNIQVFAFEVKWYNPPRSLSDPEYAIKALKHIIPDDELSLLLKGKSSGYREALNRYWQKMDPTPGTRFNPLMQEYYERIDYAASHFSSLFRKDGPNSDRGKIFVKYGKPISVERTYNREGKAVETWLYYEKKFIFVDEKGTGEFLLMKG